MWPAGGASRAVPSSRPLRGRPSPAMGRTRRKGGRVSGASTDLYSARRGLSRLLAQPLTPTRDRATRATRATLGRRQENVEAGAVAGAAADFDGAAMRGDD